ncbi:MAG: OmpH family outer membrane protein [Planctomycetota bacterium]
MKTLALAATAATTLAAALAAAPTAHGQAPAPVPPAAANAPKYGIAVVDVSYIFKNHAAFRASMDGMKGEMQQIEQQLEAERQKMIAKEEEKKGYKPGSAEYDRADDDLARMKAQVQLNMQRLRKDFLEKEAKVYYTTYQEVSRAIAYYAQQQKIGLVLRFNGEAADPAQRESILRDINKPVQYQNQIDITPAILTLVNRNAAQPGAPRTARPGSTPPPRR